MDLQHKELDTHIKREITMGEYECWDCNETFWLEEPPEDPPEDPRDKKGPSYVWVCDECKKEHRKKSATFHNVMLRDYPEKLEGRK